MLCLSHNVLEILCGAFGSPRSGNPPAKIQRIFGLCKKKTKLFNGLWPINKIYCLSGNAQSPLEQIVRSEAKIRKVRRIFGTAKFLVEKICRSYPCGKEYANIGAKFLKIIKFYFPIICST